jgi:FKBP-type peptidyl-prolyl cis-trans isomerases 2
MRKVQFGDVVSIHLVGNTSSGEVFEDTYQSEPFVFEVGSPEIIPGLSEDVVGMSEGEEKEVVIPSDKAFGPRDPNLVRTVSRAGLELDVEPELGMLLSLFLDTPRGEIIIPARVIEVTEEDIPLDLNPPLAGEDLYCSIKLVRILNE